MSPVIVGVVATTLLGTLLDDAALVGSYRDRPHRLAQSHRSRNVTYEAAEAPEL